MHRRLLLAVLLCVALIGGAMPVLAADMRGPDGVAPCSHRHDDMSAMQDMQLGDSAAPCTDTAPNHAMGGSWAGCIGGAGCFSPIAIGLHPPLQSPARLVVDRVRWPDLGGDMTALSIPPDLRPPRAIS